MRRSAAAVAAALLVLAGCASARVDNPAFLHDLTTHHAAEVTVRGTVTQVFPDQTGPTGPHQVFDISVAGHAVEVDHNLTLAPPVPLTVGDIVVVHGQFNPDPGHPDIDYTHHATGRHPGGWVTLRGHRYW
ncbi:MAG: DUF3465 domain-containing protein [Mycobacteriales bacterium]